MISRSAVWLKGLATHKAFKRMSLSFTVGSPEVAMFGASPIANTDTLDSPPPRTCCSSGAAGCYGIHGHGCSAHKAASV
eukprot:2927950-Amphidinium_carterae.1